MLSLCKGVGVRDGRGGDRTEADAGFPEPDGEVHLVATDEEPHVGQTYFEEDV